MNELQIEKRYSSNLEKATRSLKRVFHSDPKFTGLNGWIYEQTIRYCISKELEARKVKAKISEQEKLELRKTVDLRIGDVLIETKRSGLYNRRDVAKHRKYREVANARRLEYLFITGGETYKPYRKGIVGVVGKDNAFFLDSPGEWKRFVYRLLSLLKQ